MLETAIGGHAVLGCGQQGKFEQDKQNDTPAEPDLHQRAGEFGSKGAIGDKNGMSVPSQIVALLQEGDIMGFLEEMRCHDPGHAAADPATRCRFALLSG